MIEFRQTQQRRRWEYVRKKPGVVTLYTDAQQQSQQKLWRTGPRLLHFWSQEPNHNHPVIRESKTYCKGLRARAKFIKPTSLLQQTICTHNRQLATGSDCKLLTTQTYKSDRSRKPESSHEQPLLWSQVFYETRLITNSSSPRRLNTN